MVNSGYDFSKALTDQLLEPIYWGDVFSVNIPELDREHEFLVSLINRCIISVNGGDDSREEINLILDEMIKYTQFHFDHEERMLKETNYPHLEDHQHEHQVFHSFIEQAIEKYHHNVLTTSDLLKFLKDWLINHILDVDMAYKPCTNKAR